MFTRRESEYKELEEMSTQDLEDLSFRIMVTLRERELGEYVDQRNNNNIDEVE